MKPALFLLTDYRGNFGSKYKARPYRSGFDKSKITAYFNQAGYEVVYFNPSDPGFNKDRLYDNIILFTSSEDKGLFYKHFIDDFILTATRAGIRCIPDQKYLLMHEDKILFENFRHMVFRDKIDGLRSWCFGTYEDFFSHKDFIEYPVVIKTSQGSMSKGTFLANNQKEAVQIAKWVSATLNFRQQFKDFIRGFRHEGYAKESWHRKGFICQQFIPDLKNDWKVLIFNEKYYVLKRGIRTGDFRASGQGLLSYEATPIPGLLDFAKSIFTLFGVPMCSLDICFDGNRYYLLEAQLVFFGTYTLEFSDFYFQYNGIRWGRIDRISELEEEYVSSINIFLNK